MPNLSLSPANGDPAPGTWFRRDGYTGVCCPHCGAWTAVAPEGDTAHVRCGLCKWERDVRLEKYHA